MKHDSVKLQHMVEIYKKSVQSSLKFFFGFEAFSGTLQLFSSANSLLFLNYSSDGVFFLLEKFSELFKKLI